jgi:hypothetical protein
MASTLVKVFVGLGAIVMGVGVTLFFNSIIPTETNTLIGIGIVMVLASYVALYALTKSAG